MWLNLLEVALAQTSSRSWKGCMLPGMVDGEKKDNVLKLPGQWSACSLKPTVAQPAWFEPPPAYAGPRYSAAA